MKRKTTVREIRAEAIASECYRCALDSGDSTGYAAMLFAGSQIRATPRPVSKAAARSAPKKRRSPPEQKASK